MNLFPDGVDVDRQWAASPPCAGLQDVAWQVRSEMFGHMGFRISGDHQMWYETMMEEAQERLATSEQ
eukprot:1191542-Prorocentrum_lima.AAC.1